MALAKMGMTDITVYDYDIVSVENMNCQLYRHRDIGKAKVLALQEIVADFTNTIIKTGSKWEPSTFANNLTGIVVSAADSMAVREAAHSKVVSDCLFVERFIDARMGAESMYILNTNPRDEKSTLSYRKSLYKDEDAEQSPCTAKATIYCANLVSGLIASMIKEIVAGQVPTKMIIYDVASQQFNSAKQYA
jgi:molybdopterin/thiamine biosynthesis adenylyltransferase